MNVFEAIRKTVEKKCTCFWGIRPVCVPYEQMDGKKELNELLDRISNGSASQADLQRYARWCDQFQNSTEEITDFSEIKRSMSAEINKRIHPGSRYRTLRKWGYAAACALLLFAGWLGWRAFEFTDLKKETNIKNRSVDILPGGNRATLQVGQGELFDLSQEQAGIVMEEGSISYADGKTVLGALPAASHYVLSTPKGGQYQVTLPDGSKVWLNAATTLKYPSRFADSARVVELIGEAFFEIRKVANEAGRIPFLVKTKGQTVEVLGTEFNISAYPEESITRTTLVKGTVRVTDHQSKKYSELKPDMQSITGMGTLHVEKVNVSSAIAWKNGLFIFNETPLKEAMSQLSRWYDVEVVYDPAVPPALFFGVISRDIKLRSVLNILKEGGVNFKVVSSESGNKLVVLP